jgi:GntR family transcriptional regulator
MAEPMYRRIAQELRQQIQSGTLGPGERLPTEIELMDRYNASRNTVRDAIRLLATLGLVETRPGMGTFVIEKIEPFVTTLSADPETGLGGGEGKAAYAEVTERGREPMWSTPRVEVHMASGNIAARLRIPAGTQVVSRHQERFIDGTPWSLQTTYYPMDLIEQGAEELWSAREIPGGAVAYLKNKLGIVQVGYRDRIQVRSPNETESRFFRLPDDGRTSVISISRTAYQASDEGPIPFRATFTIFPADRNQLVINSGEVPSALAVPAEVEL